MDDMQHQTGVLCWRGDRHQRAAKAIRAGRVDMAGALAGTTVLELSRVSPGTFCTMVLADMGADVLKIETPGILCSNTDSRAQRKG